MPVQNFRSHTLKPLVLLAAIAVANAAMTPAVHAADTPLDTTMTFNVPQAFSRNTQPQGSALGGADVLTQESVTAGFNVGSRTGFGLNWNFSGSAQRLVSNSEFSTGPTSFERQTCDSLPQTGRKTSSSQTCRTSCVPRSTRSSATPRFC